MVAMERPERQLWEVTMEDWKPIATAPKDGREIRVKRDGHEEKTVVWAHPFDDWAVDYQGEVVGWKLLGWQPTHWKPIERDTLSNRV
jgi:hypothetical protein